MRTNLSITILLAAILFFTISCKKEGKINSISQINIPKFQECFNSHPHDSTAVANKLIGTWHWLESGCMNSYSAASPSKTGKVIFDSSGTFSMSENSSIIAQGSWQIKMIGSNGFGVDSTALQLVADPPSGYLDGLIYICDNQFLLGASYYDGCNTLYEKE